MKPCCGGMRRRPRRATSIPVQYAGARSIHLVSSQTMRSYRFSPENPVQKVDERDLALILSRKSFSRAV